MYIVHIIIVFHCDELFTMQKIWYSCILAANEIAEDCYKILLSIALVALLKRAIRSFLFFYKSKAKKSDLNL